MTLNLIIIETYIKLKIFKKREIDRVSGNSPTGISSSTSPGSIFNNRILISMKVIIVIIIIATNIVTIIIIVSIIADELEAGAFRLSDCRVNFSDIDEVFSYTGPLVIKTTLDVLPANGET